jgi:3-deoxy-D-manno-octulosonate 8-phosphate phosphatase (KDO 8-P phosphatase)
MQQVQLDERLRRVRVLLSDVDGVLTDGGIFIDNNGIETKRFNVKDGLGIALLQSADIHVALLTARTSHIVEARAAELRISQVVQGATDKGAAYRQFIQETGLADEAVAYIGDDLVDIPVLRQVGVAFTVADAVDEVKEIAPYVTSCCGGHGAVREIAEQLLQAQGYWPEILRKYHRHHEDRT